MVRVIWKSHLIALRTYLSTWYPYYTVNLLVQLGQTTFFTYLFRSFRHFRREYRVLGKASLNTLSSWASLHWDDKWRNSAEKNDRRVVNALSDTQKHSWKKPKSHHILKLCLSALLITLQPSSDSEPDASDSSHTSGALSLEVDYFVSEPQSYTLAGWSDTPSLSEGLYSGAFKCIVGFWEWLVFLLACRAVYVWKLTMIGGMCKGLLAVAANIPGSGTLCRLHDSI